VIIVDNGEVKKLDNGRYLIDYLGKEYETKYYYEDLTVDKCEELKNKYYNKPDIYDVYRQIQQTDAGGVKKNHIEGYFFKDLISKVRIHHSRWSIEEMWNSKHLIRHFYDKIMENKELYSDSSEIKKIETALRIGGKRVCVKPSNYPIKSAREVISKYINPEDNYLDFACGWGIRLLAALNVGVNYYGIDPNYLLVDRLKELSKLYKKAVFSKVDLVTDIRDTISEEYIPEWQSKMDLAFTSIPYYNLEDYRVGNQSYEEGLLINNG
jgi:DNA modification methylase